MLENQHGHFLIKEIIRQIVPRADRYNMNLVGKNEKISSFPYTMYNKM
jgi:hypothetical protein